MIVHKAFKFRVYPTEPQIVRIVAWESALRFLWNLALEQRLLGLNHCKKDKHFPTAFDQMKELTELRSELPWLEDVPRNVCNSLLVNLDQAWQHCFKKIAKRPRWKCKGQDFLSLTESHSKIWALDGSVLRFPKLGNLRIVAHRSLEGTPTSCTLSRDGDQWFVSIICQVEVADPVQRIDPVVAIDRGVTNLLADSDGRIVVNPKHLEKSLKRLAHAQRTVSRRKKGSKNREKAKLKVANLHRKVRRQRDHVLHELSASYSKSHGTVVVEKLNVRGMVKNHCLARRIAGAGWSRFESMLRYKMLWSGGHVVEVPAAYSSQTCFVCGHIDAESRHGEKFHCTKCGNVDHADLNASKVLKTRVNRSGLLVEASGLPSLRSKKLRVVLRPVRQPSSKSPSV